jgi:hypothetical protein
VALSPANAFTVHSPDTRERIRYPSRPDSTLNHYRRVFAASVGLEAYASPGNRVVAALAGSIDVLLMKG